MRIDGLELRAEVGDGDVPAIFGHAAVFNSMSEDLGGFREQIAPGAFAQTIAEDDIRALFNHRDDYVLGRNRSGTLTLGEDDAGLSVRMQPPDTDYARNLIMLIQRGDVSGMSFGFTTISDEWQMQDGEPLRTLKAVRLYDVSPVTFPAYPQTDVGARAQQSDREMRALLKIGTALTTVQYRPMAIDDVALRSLAAFRETLQPQNPWRRELARRRLELES